MKTSMQGDVNMMNGNLRMVIKGGFDSSGLVDAQSTKRKLAECKTQ